MDHQSPERNTTASSPNGSLVGVKSRSSATPAENESLLVNEVLLAYVDFAEKHYSDGQQVSTELANSTVRLLLTHRK